MTDYFKGVPIKVDPNASKGTMYFMHENFLEFRTLVQRSRWQKIKDWLRKHMKFLT